MQSCVLCRGSWIDGSPLNFCQYLKSRLQRIMFGLKPKVRDELPLQNHGDGFWKTEVDERVGAIAHFRDAHVVDGGNILVDEDATFFVGRFRGPIEAPAHGHNLGIFNRSPGFIDHKNGG